jgi:hypothetical protein
MEVFELDKNRWKDFKLHFKWSSDRYYKVDIRRTQTGWMIELKLQTTDKPIVKDYEEPLWQKMDG